MKTGLNEIKELLPRKEEKQHSPVLGLLVNN
jgi:hypothetical protein